MIIMGAQFGKPTSTSTPKKIDIEVLAAILALQKQAEKASLKGVTNGSLQSIN